MLRNALLLSASLTMVAACGADDPGDPMIEDAPVLAPEPDNTAMRMVTVSMSPTQGNKASGTLTVSENDNGVTVTGRLMGLPPDQEVGFHVHEFGDCSAPDASSAGEHFNPTGQPHGDPGSDDHHLGDMENLDVNDEGVADVDAELDDVTLNGPADRSVRNRAIVVHMNTDDYETQPSGGSGNPIACGVIGGAMGATGTTGMQAPGTPGVAGTPTQP